MMLETDKDLIKRNRYWDNCEKSPDFERLVGSPEPGSLLSITWSDPLLHDVEDTGYIFATPESSPQDFNFFVHVPRPENPGGKDSVEPIWEHLYDLLDNPEVKQVIVRTTPT